MTMPERHRETSEVVQALLAQALLAQARPDQIERLLKDIETGCPSARPKGTA